MRRSLAVFGFSATLTLCACGGGAQSARPAALATAAAASPSKLTKALLTLTIPDPKTAAKRRLPKYVSSYTLSATAVVNPGNLTTNVDLSASSPNCTAITSGRACTIAISAPIGTDTVALTLYDGICTGSPCVASGDPLSAASNFAVNVTEGTSNVSIPLVLGGIPSSATITVGTDPGGTTHDVPVTVTAFDEEGGTIVGPPYVNASGVATPIVLEAELEPSINGNDPTFKINGGATATGNIVSVGSPSDVVALTVNSTSGNVLGAAIRSTSGLATTAYGYYKAYGTTTTIPSPFTGWSTYGITGTFTALAPANPNSSNTFNVVAGSSSGWITNITTSSNWSSNSPVVNMYCRLSSTAGNVEGIGVDAQRNTYVSYFDSGHSYIAEVPVYANLSNPCSSAAGYASATFAEPGNLGGAVLATPSTIFFINHATTSTPPLDEEMTVATPGLGTTAYFYFTPTGGISNGIAGAVVDPTDGTIWVVARFTNTLYHISGTPGTPGSYGIAGSYGLNVCGPDDIVTDGTLLYISCSGSAVTMVVTPNGLGTPAINSITTAAGIGLVAQWQDIAIGPDGYLWILTSPTTLTKFDRHLGGAAVGSVTYSGGSLNAVVNGADGDLWLTDSLSTDLTRLGSGVGP